MKAKLDYYGAFNGNDFTICTTEDKKKIATVHFDHAGIVEAQNPTDATRYANLFTASPELLEALKHLVEPTSQRELDDWTEKAREIIKKAEGN